MKRNLYYLVLAFCVISGSGFAQDVYFDPGVGLYFNRFKTETSQEGFTAVRANLGVHNLIAKRLGFYVTAEYSPSIPNGKHVREIVGGNIRINNTFSVFGGMGILKEGVLGNDFQKTRKEIGLEVTMLQNKLNVDLGISGSGPSVTVGYMIPAILHAGEKAVQKKRNDEKKQADDLVNALKQVDECKTTSAKEIGDLRSKLADTQSALKNAESARLAAESALKDTKPSNNAVEDRTVSRSRATEVVTNLASKSKSNLNGAVSLLNGSEMVTFKYGTSELGKSFTSKLNQLKSFLDSSPEYSLLITGHACDLGTDEANQALSDARSESVKKYLVEQGLPANRVLVKGFGERAPMVPNNNESNRRKNRRVDFSLVNN